MRDAIAETYPEIFHDYETPMCEPGGFHRACRPATASGRPKTGKANLIVADGAGRGSGHAGAGPTCCA